MMRFMKQMIKFRHLTVKTAIHREFQPIRNQITIFEKMFKLGQESVTFCVFIGTRQSYTYFLISRVNSGKL